MSSSYSRQGRSISDLRKLVEGCASTPKPRRETLTKAETKRLSKLRAIATQLKSGKNVQNRKLQTWLTEEEYAQIGEGWQEQLNAREELKKNKPSAVKDYEEILRLATLYYNRSEGYSTRGHHKTAKKFYYQSESCCEQAVEFLQEQLDADPSLCLWFDRAISFDIEDGIGADLALLPRVVTSRSIEKIRGHFNIMTKLEVKLGVVERAIDKIGRD